jgi:hypothetical protein
MPTSRGTSSRPARRHREGAPPAPRTLSSGLLDSNDYSVHPAAIGRLVEVRADLQTVTVTLAGTTVAEHPRCWARHQSLTDPAHQEAAAALRDAPRSPAA